MREITDFNDNWRFGGDEVRLPHTCVELPFNYFNETSYQHVFVYEKTFAASNDWEGREVSVVFEGAMANARVLLNNAAIATHSDGYTPFSTRLNEHLKPGENLLRVEIDGSENPDIPPFGGRIDYLTYAGIYREVSLCVTSPVSISCCKIETPNALATSKSLTAAITLANPQALKISGKLTAVLKDAAGQAIAEQVVDCTSDTLTLAMDKLADINLWDIHSPTLYTLCLTLETPHGNDETTERFGFRTAEFTTDGFKLNGQLLKIRGLNRHQSFPYVGYALGKAAQVRDADILKFDLRLNLVRTSHYPQSTDFLDRCDEIGLLVFEEIPGWQHIGDKAWQGKAVENVRAMIERDWNHPSIIIWGVRINESFDSHDFYTETNQVAHELDSTRATGGVRCHVNSEFLEDVYTMNDFSLGEEELGGNRYRTPLRPQQECTGLDHQVPYMITEYNGHMYPTKSTDQEQRQHEHVLRHLEVLDAAYGASGTAGAIGWCAFDYNTHKDFGSGDRICYHGVMDMFREPKFAAYAYASQDDPSRGVVLEPATLWARGERNIQGVLPLFILTNCDEIEFCFADSSPIRIAPDTARFPHLPHAPVVAEARHFPEAVFGTWGADWQGVTIKGYLNGEMVKSRAFVADPVPAKLEVVADASEISWGDDVRVMIRALDQAHNKLRYLTDPVQIEIDGPARLFGPTLSPLRAGSAGFWLRATGAGNITATVRHARFKDVSVSIKAV